MPRDYSSFDILNLSESPYYSNGYNHTWYDDSSPGEESSDINHHDIRTILTKNRVTLPPLVSTYSKFSIRDHLDKMAISSFDFRIIPNSNSFISLNYKNFIPFTATRTEPGLKSIGTTVLNTNLPPLPTLEFIVPGVTNPDSLISTNELKCRHCHKNFGYRNTLSRHERLHTGEKRYHCVPCKKSFSRKDILLRHKTSQKCQYVKFRETYKYMLVPEAFLFGHFQYERDFSGQS